MSERIRPYEEVGEDLDKGVVIFGEGKFARYAISTLEETGLNVAALTVEGEYISQEKRWGKRLTPFEDLIDSYPPDDYDMFVAVGVSDLNGTLNGLREKFIEECHNKGYRLKTIVHPSAVIGREVMLGDNVFIPPLNNIDHFVSIGTGTILWAQNHLGHESNVEEYIFITSGVTISGSCNIGRNSFLGVNSAIADGVNVGRNNFIGMGAMISKDTRENAFVVPAKSEVKPYTVNDWLNRK